MGRWGQRVEPQTGGHGVKDRLAACMDKKTVGEDAKVTNLNYGKNEGCRAEEEGRSSCRS